MKQERNQIFENNHKKYSKFDQSKEDQQSLLDIQQEEIVEQSPSQCNRKSDPNTIQRYSSMQGLGLSKFAQAISMQKFDQFLQSASKNTIPSKTQNKRPQTLVETKLHHRTSESSNDKIMISYHSSPDRAIKYVNEDDSQINIRTFQSKFIRVLNFRDNEKLRKSRKRLHLNKNSEAGSYQVEKKAVNPHIKKPLHEIWYNGIRVLSQFKNDLIHGSTQIYYPHGAKFIGRYQQGVRTYGNFDFNNGYIYFGNFWGDKFQGQGQLTLPNGKVYSGDWFDNQLLDKVQIKYPSGDIYYGEIKDFKKHGKGYLFFKNGQKFVGEFQNGKIFGKGQYFIDEQCVGRGFWKNGELIQKVQENEEFSFFDTPSSLSKKSIPIPQSNESKNQQKSQQKNQKQDFMTFEVIDEQQQLHIQVRSNNKMISLNQIQTNTDISSRKIKSIDKNKKVCFTNIVNKNVNIQKDKSQKQNIADLKISINQKSRSSRRLKTQKIKKPQFQSNQASDTCDDQCFQTAQMLEMCNKIQNMNPIYADNQTLQTENHLKTSKNGYLSSSIHSQSSQNGLFKTGKFNSFKGLTKNDSNSDTMIVS